MKILLLADYQDQQLRLTRGEHDVSRALAEQLVRVGLAQIVARGAAVRVMTKPDGRTVAIKRGEDGEG